MPFPLAVRLVLIVPQTVIDGKLTQGEKHRSEPCPEQERRRPGIGSTQTTVSVLVAGLGKVNIGHPFDISAWFAAGSHEFPPYRKPTA